MKALEYFALDKENFESYLDNVTLTDEQWASLVDEIDTKTAEFLDELIGILVQEIEEGKWD